METPAQLTAAAEQINRAREDAARDQAALLNELIRRHKIRIRAREELQRAEELFNEQWKFAQTKMPDLFDAITDD